MEGIISYIRNGFKTPQQLMDESVLNQKYWDKAQMQQAAGVKTPINEHPTKSQAQAFIGVTPSPKAGLGKIADDLYNGIFNRDNKMHSPIPVNAQETNSIPVSTPTPSPTRIPSATPTPTLSPVIPTKTPARPVVSGPQKIDFTGYTSKTLPGGKLPEVPQNLSDMFFQVFGGQNEATPAAAVTVGENAGFNPNAVGAMNQNGTTDYGLMQINSGTFDGLKKRRPKEMAAIGITADTPYSVLFDPLINMKVAQLVRKDEQWSGSQPFSQWYGWQDPPLGKGINLQERINKLKNKK